MELPPDNPSGRVAGMKDSGGELLTEAVAISTLWVRDLEEKVMGCLGGVLARFLLRELIILHKHEELHLCEHYSTAWIHFCLLEFAMMWQICALSSCKCWLKG